MQYILTEAEYDNLLDTAKKASKSDTANLQAFCTRVANELPVYCGWGDALKRPWMCVLTEKKKEWYCDSCPARAVCPSEHKKWSK